MSCDIQGLGPKKILRSEATRHTFPPLQLQPQQFLLTLSPYVNSNTSTFWRVSGTRVTLNRLTLAYSLPKKWTSAIGISNVRVNVTGQNLLSLYNPYPNKFIDPMMGYGAYPTLRKFTIGLNVTF